jgi:uncharacterized protein
MRWLIDGYNLMHAGGLARPGLVGEAFRRARRRFLDEISLALGPERASETTVVFDASVPPGDFALASTYRGLAVLFALGDENADARIEKLIAGHSNPKALTVVSTDRRVREAASRRRSRSVTALQFWEEIDDLKERHAARPKDRVDPKPGDAPLTAQPSAAESAMWLETFRHVDEQDDVKEVLSERESLLTDAEVEAIEREIEDEIDERDD